MVVAAPMAIVKEMSTRDCESFDMAIAVCSNTWRSNKVLHILIIIFVSQKSKSVDGKFARLRPILSSKIRRALFRARSSVVERSIAVSTFVFLRVPGNE